MPTPYFRQLPNFEYVNRLKDNTEISSYLPVKNLFKRFVINQNHYSFGPQLIYKKAEWKALAEKAEDELTDEEREQLNAIMSTNTDLVRITNSGRFKCTVDLGLEDFNEASADVFQVEPANLELEEGETKDVRVWSFPKEVGEYSNALLACVTNNPEPLRFELKSWGVEPTIDIEGPWADAIAEAEKAVEECTDKKALKGLEDALAALKASFTFTFERQLVGKTESKTFTVYNTCQLPVAWEIDSDDFACFRKSCRCLLNRLFVAYWARRFRTHTFELPAHTQKVCSEKFCRVVVVLYTSGGGLDLELLVICLRPVRFSCLHPPEQVYTILSTVETPKWLEVCWSSSKMARPWHA